MTGSDGLLGEKSQPAQGVLFGVGSGCGWWVGSLVVAQLCWCPYGAWCPPGPASPASQQCRGTKIHYGPPGVAPGGLLGHGKSYCLWKPPPVSTCFETPAWRPGRSRSAGRGAEFRVPCVFVHLGLGQGVASAPPETTIVACRSGFPSVGRLMGLLCVSGCIAYLCPKEPRHTTGCCAVVCW